MYKVEYGLRTDGMVWVGWVHGWVVKVDNVFGWMSCVQGGSIVVFSSLTIHRFSLFFHDMIS